MMTPEQRDCLRSFLNAPHPFSNAQTLFLYVDSMLAAERAAELERCVAIIDASCVINEAQAVALIAAIRAQGGGNG